MTAVVDGYQRVFRSEFPPFAAVGRDRRSNFVLCRPKCDRHQSCTNREIYLNWDRIEGNWKQAKGKVQEQWGKLTDDYLDKNF